MKNHQGFFRFLEAKNDYFSFVLRWLIKNSGYVEHFCRDSKFLWLLSKTITKKEWIFFFKFPAEHVEQIIFKTIFLLVHLNVVAERSWGGFEAEKGNVNQQLDVDNVGNFSLMETPKKWLEIHLFLIANFNLYLVILSEKFANSKDVVYHDRNDETTFIFTRLWCVFFYWNSWFIIQL